MKITLDQATSLPLIVQPDAYRLDFTFYYSTSAVRDAEQLVDNNARCSKIQVVKVSRVCVIKTARLMNFIQAAKRLGSFDGPDTITFFVRDATRSFTTIIAHIGSGFCRRYGHTRG